MPFLLLFFPSVLFDCSDFATYRTRSVSKRKFTEKFISFNRSNEYLEYKFHEHLRTKIRRIIQLFQRGTSMYDDSFDFKKSLQFGNA